MIPARNAAATVGTTLQSVLGQSLPAARILVVDDGSTDETAKVVREVAPTQATVLTGERRGVAAARNLGIRSATTAWVALLDADDAWRPGLLEAVARRVRDRPDVLACFVAADAIDDQGRLIAVHAMPEGAFDGHRLIGGEITPTTSATVVARDRVLALGGFYEDFERPSGVEDLDLWFRLAATGPCLGIAERLGIYVVHEARDRARTAEALSALQRDRERVIDRLAEHDLPRKLVRRARAVMRARTGRYWLVADRPAEARGCALRSLRTRPTVEGSMTLAATLLSTEARGRARTALRAYRTRGGG